MKKKLALILQFLPLLINSSSNDNTMDVESANDQIRDEGSIIIPILNYNDVAENMDDQDKQTILQVDNYIDEKIKDQVNDSSFDDDNIALNQDHIVIEFNQNVNPENVDLESTSNTHHAQKRLSFPPSENELISSVEILIDIPSLHTLLALKPFPLDQHRALLALPESENADKTDEFFNAKELKQNEHELYHMIGSFEDIRIKAFGGLFKDTRVYYKGNKKDVDETKIYVLTSDSTDFSKIMHWQSNIANDEMSVQMMKKILKYCQGDDDKIIENDEKIIESNEKVILNIANADNKLSQKESCCPPYCNFECCENIKEWCSNIDCKDIRRNMGQKIKEWCNNKKTAMIECRAACPTCKECLMGPWYFCVNVSIELGSLLLKFGRWIKKCFSTFEQFKTEFIGKIMPLYFLIISIATLIRFSTDLLTPKYSNGKDGFRLPSTARYVPVGWNALMCLFSFMLRCDKDRLNCKFFDTRVLPIIFYVAVSYIFSLIYAFVNGDVLNWEFGNKNFALSNAGDWGYAVLGSLVSLFALQISKRMIGNLMKNDLIEIENDYCYTVKMKNHKVNAINNDEFEVSLNIGHGEIKCGYLKRAFNMFPLIMRYAYVVYPIYNTINLVTTKDTSVWMKNNFDFVLLSIPAILISLLVSICFHITSDTHPNETQLIKEEKNSWNHFFTAFIYMIKGMDICESVVASMLMLSFFIGFIASLV